MSRNSKRSDELERNVTDTNEVRAWVTQVITTIDEVAESRQRARERRHREADRFCRTRIEDELA